MDPAMAEAMAKAQAAALATCAGSGNVTFVGAGATSLSEDPIKAAIEKANLQAAIEKANAAAKASVAANRPGMSPGLAGLAQGVAGLRAPVRPGMLGGREVVPLGSQQMFGGGQAPQMSPPQMSPPGSFGSSASSPMGFNTRPQFPKQAPRPMLGGPRPMGLRGLVHNMPQANNLANNAMSFAGSSKASALGAATAKGGAPMQGASFAKIPLQGPPTGFAAVQELVQSRLNEMAAKASPPGMSPPNMSPPGMSPPNMSSPPDMMSPPPKADPPPRADPPPLSMKEISPALAALMGSMGMDM